MVMFEDCLVESSARLTPRHPWTTVVSFAAQIAICGWLLLLSLIYTESLPTQRWINMLQAPPPPPPAAPVPQHVVASAAQGSGIVDVIVVPREVPTTIGIIHDDLTPAGNTVMKDGVVGSISGPSNGAVTEILRSAVPAAPKLSASKVRVSSGVAQGLLVRRVNPVYPQMARTARIEGRVVLQATIGKDGSVQNLHLISGHPMLVQSAMDAVKRWLYRPYYLNGEPVEVDTTITVNVTLTP